MRRRGTDREEADAVILGYQLTWMNIILGGTVVGLLLAFQVLVGMRKIKFKGRLHMRVHKYGAWVLLALGVVHGLLALTVYNHWSIL